MSKPAGDLREVGKEDRRLPGDAAKRRHAPESEESFAGSEDVTVQPDFEPFHQNNDMFCRGFWDPKVSNKMTWRFFRSFVKPGERFRDAEGFTQRDYALRNGPWVVTEMLAEMHKGSDRRDGFWDDFTPHVPPKVESMPIEDEREAAANVKRVARIYGANLVGITAYDPKWTYGSKFSARSMSCKPMELPEGLTSAIVIAKSMDIDLVRTSPSATASAAPAIGYAHDATLLLALAQYIRSLGYEAVACQNDTTLAIPYAVQAGLGEYGRNGLLITKEYGPRVRLGRVLTDMPLAHDKPIQFGVAKTCHACRRCANNCPPQAIDHGDPSDYRFGRSNIKGVRKWTTDAEKCFKFWVSRGSDCANCIRSCPYNKDFTKWPFRALRWALGTPLRRLALRADDALNMHHQMEPSGWWKPNRSEWRILERGPNHRPDPAKMQQQERVKAIRDAK
jgi:epoxyqueuosine reductase